MSNDYAMFIIHLPNDFDKVVSPNPVTSRTIKATPSIVSLLTNLFSLINLNFQSNQLIQHQFY